MRINMTNRINFLRRPRIKGVLFICLLLITLLAVWGTTGGWGRRASGIGESSNRGVSNATAHRVDAQEDQICRLPAAPASFDASSTGRTISVNGGPDAASKLQIALNSAAPGDVIELKAGAIFVGNFTLPEKHGEAWVTIRPSSEVVLPPQDMRITPAVSSSLPKIITPNADAAVKTAPRAHHYRLVGIEISVGANVRQNHGLVLFGDGSGAQRSLDVVPHDLILDRCYLHGNGTGELRRGIALNSARASVVDSYIAACQGIGYDTQAIAGWNGPGPFKIVNNYLEGAGENVMFGGADPSIPNLVPSDIEFRDNYCAKPLAWKAGEQMTGAAARTRPPSVKNLFELKNARRVLVEGNVFERNWADAQNGFAILLTVRNQDGTAPWSVVEDITFRRNVVRSVGAGINLLGRDYNRSSQQLRRVRIEQNLFEDVGGAQWGGNGSFLQVTESSCVVVDHNTVFHTGNLVTGYGQSNTDFAFTNNVARHNEYGVFGDGVGSGKAALDKYFPASQFTGNVLMGGRRELYPAGNFFPSALDGSGVQSIGADVVALRNRAAKVRTGDMRP